jgi:hypothetical protein
MKKQKRDWLFVRTENVDPDGNILRSFLFGKFPGEKKPLPTRRSGAQ